MDVWCISQGHRVPSAELRERMRIDLVSDVVKRDLLRWLGHVLRKDDDDWVKKSMSYEVEGVRGRGRTSTTCSHIVRRDQEGYERAWFENGGCARA